MEARALRGRVQVPYQVGQLARVDPLAGQCRRRRHLADRDQVAVAVQEDDDASHAGVDDDGVDVVFEVKPTSGFISAGGSGGACPEMALKSYFRGFPDIPPPTNERRAVHLKRSIQIPDGRNAVDQHFS